MRLRPRPLVADLLRRWFAVAGGMAAYAVVLVAGFWLVPVACASTGRWPLHLVAGGGLVVAALSLAAAVVLWRGDPRPAPPPPPPRRGPWGVVHLTGLLLRRTWLAAAGLLWAAARIEQAEPPPPEAATPQRQREMAAVGIGLGVLSVLLVLFHWAPVLVLDPCA